jgi:hypothetical protein
MLPNRLILQMAGLRSFSSKILIVRIEADEEELKGLTLRPVTSSDFVCTTENPGLSLCSTISCIIEAKGNFESSLAP